MEIYEVDTSMNVQLTIATNEAARQQDLSSTMRETSDQIHGPEHAPRSQLFLLITTGDYFRFLHLRMDSIFTNHMKSSFTRHTKSIANC